MSASFHQNQCFIDSTEYSQHELVEFMSFVTLFTVTGLACLCPIFGLYTDLIPDFPQPLTLMSSTMMANNQYKPVVL